MTYIRIRRGTPDMTDADKILFEELRNGTVINQIAIEPLPNRRPGITQDFYWNGERLHLCIGFSPHTARPVEAFLKGFKDGSDRERDIDNDMIALSKLIQTGSDPSELADTFTTDTIMGAVAAVIAGEIQ